MRRLFLVSYSAALIFNMVPAGGPGPVASLRDPAAFFTSEALQLRAMSSKSGVGKLKGTVVRASRRFRPQISSRPPAPPSPPAPPTPPPSPDERAAKSVERDLQALQGRMAALLVPGASLPDHAGSLEEFMQGVRTDIKQNLAETHLSPKVHSAMLELRTSALAMITTLDNRRDLTKFLAFQMYENFQETAFSVYQEVTEAHPLYRIPPVLNVPGTGRLLAAHRSVLTEESLERAARRLAGMTPMDPAELEWQILALQRRWPALKGPVRRQIKSSLRPAQREGRLTASQAAALRRVVLSAPNPSVPWPVGGLLPDQWNSAASTERKADWIRRAVQVLQDEAGTAFIPIGWVAGKLGVEEEGLQSFITDELHEEPGSFSLLTGDIPDNLITSAAFALREQPYEVLKKEIVEGLLNPFPDAHWTAEGNSTASGRRLRDWARRLGIISSPIPKKLRRYFRGWEAVWDQAKGRKTPNVVRELFPEWDRESGAYKPSRLPRTTDPFLEQNPLYRFWARRAILAMTQGEPPVPVEQLRATHFQEARVKGLREWRAATVILTHYTTENDSGVELILYALQKFGFLKAPMPFNDVTTLEQFRAFLDTILKGHTIPWESLSQPLQQALVKALSEATGKPVEWLSEEDYETVPIKALSKDGKEFTLRDFYHYFSRRNRQSSPLPEDVAYRPDEVPLYILRQIGLLADPLLKHAAQRLQTADDLRNALQKKWLQHIPWRYLHDQIRRTAFLELAVQQGRAPKDLTSEDFNKPLRTLNVFKKKRNAFAPVAIRGLYLIYENDPDRPPTMRVADWMAIKLNALEGPDVPAGVRPTQRRSKFLNPTEVAG